MLILSILLTHLTLSAFTLLLLYTIMIYNPTIRYQPEEDAFPFESVSSQGFSLREFFLLLTLSPLAPSLWSQIHIQISVKLLRGNAKSSTDKKKQVVFRIFMSIAMMSFFFQSDSSSLQGCRHD